MKPESLALIGQIQNKYSNATKPILYSNLAEEIDSIARQVASNEGYQHTPITFVIENTEIVNFVVDLLLPHVGLIFNNCRADFLVVEKQGGNLQFRDCTFTEKIEIRTSGGATFIQGGSTETIEFSSTNEVHINSVKFRFLKLKFTTKKIRGLKITDCTFGLYVSGAVPNHEIEVNNCTFEKCTFKEIVFQSDFTFGNTVNFLDCTFTRFEDNYQPIYRKIKKDFLEHKNENLFNFFGSLELLCHHDELSKNKKTIDYKLSYLYRWMNDFGFQPYLPLKHLAWFSLAAFFGSLGYNCDLVMAFHDWFLFFLGPFRLLAKDTNFHVNNILYVAPFSILSSIFWFFLILGIRKKFKIEK